MRVLSILSTLRAKRARSTRPASFPIPSASRGGDGESRGGAAAGWLSARAASFMRSAMCLPELLDCTSLNIISFLFHSVKNLQNGRRITQIKNYTSSSNCDASRRWHADPATQSSGLARSGAADAGVESGESAGRSALGRRTGFRSSHDSTTNRRGKERKVIFLLRPRGSWPIP